jgi:predicted ABC-type ATPase
MSDKNNNNRIVNPLHVVVYAGPNGSGKTTMMNSLKAKGLSVQGHTVFPPKDEVNPDMIAKSLTHLPEGRAREEEAQREAWAMREGFLADRKPFSFETVMSHPSRINELQRLKQANYFVYLTFITTNDPQKNVERVAQRVRDNTTTGHDVPVDKIVSRYERTLDLLPKAVEVADASYVYDNSYDGKVPTLQAVIDGADIRLHDPLEPWVQTRLLDPLRDRYKEVEALEREVGKRGYQLVYPYELQGQYTGKVAFETAYYLLVHDGDKSLSVHDKVMLNAQSKQKFVIDTPCRITYDFKTQAKIELGSFREQTSSMKVPDKEPER